MYALIHFLLQPFMILSLVCGLAIANLWRCRRESRARLLWVTVPYVLLVGFSLPIVAGVATAVLESRFDPLARRPHDIEAIVVLGGYVSRPAHRGLEPELGSDTALRCIRAAALYRDGDPVPVVASGRLFWEQQEGQEVEQPSLAAVMGRVLRHLGVAGEDLILEQVSTDTWENAVESAGLLKARGIQRVLVVTDATHLPRAVACFRAQGMSVVPAGRGYQEHRLSVASFLPSHYAPERNQEVFHEIIGFLWYWVRGRI